MTYTFSSANFVSNLSPIFSILPESGDSGSGSKPNKIRFFLTISSSSSTVLGGKTETSENEAVGGEMNLQMTQ